MRRLLPLSALAVLALAPTAEASILKFDTNQAKISYEAYAGETNVVTATQEGTNLRITDTGAPITVKANSACSAVSANEATCPVPSAAYVVKLDGGDLDDQLTLNGSLSGQLEGADGNDTITGGDGDDKVWGMLGDDVLDGRGGADDVQGSDGDDVVRLIDGSVDSVSCGLGADNGDADYNDAVNADCESITRTVAPPPVVQDPNQAPPADDPNRGEQISEVAKHHGLHLGAKDLRVADPAVLALLPDPTGGRTVSAAAGSGTVLIRRPGSSSFTELDPSRSVPVGSLVDARRGSVTLVAASNLAGATQQATFTGAMFSVTQRREAAMTTVLTLKGALDCGSNRTARAAAAKKRAKKRSLWGDGHGRFTTRGKNSQASVRGTIWGVTDRCDGTLTQVKRGAVAVKDLRTGKTRVVRAGGRYLARNRAKNVR